MQCPKCKGELQHRTQGNITLDRCNSCCGLLIMPEMLDEVQITAMAEAIIDIGSPAIGREFDTIDDIECPYCHLSMNKVEDPIQTHIWMEECPNCLRLFLDAGELTDLKFETLTDKVRDLLKGHHT